MSALNAVESLQRGQPVESRTTPPAVFMHTGWRSGGTWLWSQCRAQPGMRALYEPLHEGIADLRPADIARLRPGSWRSSHGDTAPYFSEYQKLLRPGRRGVALYERRFAFDRFFMGPQDEDAALEAYLQSLLEAQAGARGVVLKFCRSLGRVAWLESRFPGALHVVVLRRPLAQWQSAQRLLLRERNRYFTIAPLLVLARNAASHPVVAACAALDVQLPALHSADLAYGMETVWRHTKRQSQAERYRTFLAYWTVTALAALQGDALAIDTALMVRSADYLAQTEAALQTRTGGRLHLTPRADPIARVEEPHGGDMAAAHEAAAAYVAASANTYAPARRAVLMDYLDEPALPASCAQLRVKRPRAARSPGAIETAALVRFAQALQPLRRMHGEILSRR